jgi:hypothetical protein
MSDFGSQTGAGTRPLDLRKVLEQLVKQRHGRVRQQIAAAGARIQSRMPDLLIRRVLGVLVIAIGAYYLSSGLA